MMSKVLGRFVEPCATERGTHAGNLRACREAIKGIGETITREEGLRQLSGEAVKSLQARNVMSPDLIAIKAMAGMDSGPLVVEVSAGEFMGDTLYGVTVYHVLPGQREMDFELSQACHSVESVAEYMRRLNGELEEDR